MDKSLLELFKNQLTTIDKDEELKKYILQGNEFKVPDKEDLLSWNDKEAEEILDIIVNETTGNEEKVHNPDFVRILFKAYMAGIEQEQFTKVFVTEFIAEDSSLNTEFLQIIERAFKGAREKVKQYQYYWYWSNKIRIRPFKIIKKEEQDPRIEWSKLQMFKFLTKNGFRRYEGNLALVNEHNRVEVMPLNANELANPVKYWIRTKYIPSLPEVLEFQVTREHILESYFHKGNKLLTSTFYQDLDPLVFKSVPQKKGKAYLHFLDGTLELSKGLDPIFYDLEEASSLGMVWHKNVIQRKLDFKIDPDKAEASIFYDFCFKVSTPKNKYRLLKSKSRVTAMIQLLGFLMDESKDLSNPKSVVFCDMKQSINDPTEQGRRGKDIPLLWIKAVKGEGFKFIDCKSRRDNAFFFAGINREHRIIHLGDLQPETKMNRFYNWISGGSEVEDKGKNPVMLHFHEIGKLVITTNWIFWNNSDSLMDRLYIHEFEPYFGKKHKPMDEYGVLLGNESLDRMDPDQVPEMINFLVYCLQQYLNDGVQTDDSHYRQMSLQLRTDPRFVDVMDSIFNPEEGEPKTEISKHDLKDAVFQALDPDTISNSRLGADKYFKDWIIDYFKEKDMDFVCSFKKDGTSRYPYYFKGNAPFIRVKM